MKQLTKKAFVAWLRQCEPDTIVGYAQRQTSCPIATFLTKKVLSPSHRAAVQRHTLYVSDYNLLGPEDNPITRIYGLPVWATEFVLAIDGFGGGTPVYAADALAIVEGEK